MAQLQAQLDGKAIPPTDSRGGYHGTSKHRPAEVQREGLPARGTNLDLLNHVAGKPDSAFRGTTGLPLSPDREAGAALWAGDGGWVYDIREVPTWDLAQCLQGRVKKPDNFFGDYSLPKEMERAIHARVPLERIFQFSEVTLDRQSRVKIAGWRKWE